MTLLIILGAPALAALLTVRCPASLLRALALAGAGASLLAALVAFQSSGQGSDLSFSTPWVPAVGLHLALRADGVSSTLLALGGLISVLAIISTRLEEIERPRLFLAMMLLTQAGAAGVFLARDMVVFYVCWEAVLVPMFVLVAGFGDGRGEAGRSANRAAALKLLIYTGVGSLGMLLAILALYVAQSGPSPSFDIAQLRHVHLAPGNAFLGLSRADLVFAGFALAFAFKSPIFPFHGWLADAYTAAPTPAVMVLAGVVSKLGPYGFYRVGVELMPAEAARFSGPLTTLAAVGIVYGALLALRQRDTKRTVAYASLSHMCFITLGIVGLTSAGLSGGVLQMANHGILIASLFFIVGHLERHTGTRDRAQLGGLARRAPALAALFLVLALAMLGLPGLNGFVGEYLIMAGTFTRSSWLLGLAAAGVVLAAWYTLRLYQGLMNGPAAEGPDADVDGADAGVLVPLAALAVVIGIYPAPLLDVINHSVSALTLALGGGG